MANDYETLLAAAIPVASKLDALENDGTMGAGYHLEQLVDAARRLRAVVNAQKAKVPSGYPSPPV